MQYITFRVVWQGQKADTRCSDPRTEHSDAVGISTEEADVLADPSQSLDLIQEAIVSFSCLIPGAEEPCNTQMTLINLCRFLFIQIIVVLKGLVKSLLKATGKSFISHPNSSSFWLIWWGLKLFKAKLLFSTVQFIFVGSYTALLQGNLHQKKGLSGKTHMGNQDLYSGTTKEVSQQVTAAVKWLIGWQGSL